jgi:hypothetical protein
MTTARDFLMEGNEGCHFRTVIDNLDEDIILDSMEEYANFKVQNSAKEIKTEDLFKQLQTAKEDIAKEFTNKYFNGESETYWLGEVLSINDYFLGLEDIQYAFENNIYETTLFKFLEKPRKYNLADYCLGKVGRKEKRKQDLKRCKESCREAWQRVRESFETNYDKTICASNIEFSAKSIKTEEK